MCESAKNWQVGKGMTKQGRGRETEASALIRRAAMQPAEFRSCFMVFVRLQLLDIEHVSSATGGLQVTEVSAAFHQTADQFHQSLRWTVIERR